jgi:ribonucleoside-triphosphate reductase
MALIVSTPTASALASSTGSMSSIGLFTFLRTYSRRHNEADPHSSIETWPQTISRVIDASDSQLHMGLSDIEKCEVAELLASLKFSVAGRFLWQLGTKTVDRMGLMSLQNCCATVIDHPVKPFTWAMNFSMLGAGIGVRVLPEDFAGFPLVKAVTVTRRDTNDADFIVPDSREGWVALLAKVLKAHFYSGKDFSYSCLVLRSKGAPIKSFGGTSSGPEVLCDGIEKISAILNARAGLSFRPIDGVDVINIIGMIVVAGNIRRSAILILGDCKDLEYLRAKRWDLGNIPNTRCYSNNSVVCNNIEEILTNDEFWEGYKGNGEPYGLINLKLMQSCGRLGEYQYPDPDVVCVNPCAEITLANFECCTLSELFLPNIASKDELFKAAQYAYRFCKHSLSLGCPSSPETEAIINKNRRIGVGITGYLQASEEQRQWLPECYTMLRAFDVQYSATHGMPPSIKLCTVKPSGTLSILGNTTPGAHPAYARYYLRRIRISAENPLVDVVIRHGHPVEYQINFDGTIDRTTKIVSFPCKFPKGTVLAKDCTAIDQLEYAKRLQTDWSDNSVSITVYYRLEELDAIKAWLRINYNDSVKSVSFLLHSDHGFKQAPLEELTKKEYKTLAAQCTPITDMTGICFHKEDFNIDELECAGGSCPVR